MTVERLVHPRFVALAHPPPRFTHVLMPRIMPDWARLMPLTCELVLRFKGGSDA